MMTTTTIRLSEELKARVAEAAKRAGTTTHGFILEAIADKTALYEKRADFVQQAEARYENIIATGETIAWDEMKNYLKANIANADAPLPKSRKLVR
jgi:predicted transcriptional regulator